MDGTLSFCIKQTKANQRKERILLMGFVNFFMAVSPIVIVLAGILAFKKPAMKVAPVALVWTDRKSVV